MHPALRSAARRGRRERRALGERGRRPWQAAARNGHKMVRQWSNGAQLLCRGANLPQNSARFGRRVGDAAPAGVQAEQGLWAIPPGPVGGSAAPARPAGRGDGGSGATGWGLIWNGGAKGCAGSGARDAALNHCVMLIGLSQSVGRASVHVLQETAAALDSHRLARPPLSPVQIASVPDGALRESQAGEMHRGPAKT
jgi:hypothetical protein